MEKQRKETSEGEDYKVMLFTFSSDLGRNAAKEKNRLTVPKEVQKRRDVVMRQRDMMRNCFN